MRCIISNSLRPLGGNLDNTAPSREQCWQAPRQWLSIMLRLAFTVYLALLALAGPGLCCCTAPEKPGQSRACCQQRNDAPGPCSPDGPAPHCPCNERRSIAAVLGAGEGQLADSVRTGHIAAFAVNLDWRPSGPTDRGAQSLRVSPGEDGTLFGRDVLRALCAMRC